MTAIERRAHDRRVQRRVARLMAFEAAALAIMAVLHLTGLLAGGSQPFGPKQAGIVLAHADQVYVPQRPVSNMMSSVVGSISSARSSARGVGFASGSLPEKRGVSDPGASPLRARTLVGHRCRMTRLSALPNFVRAAASASSPA